MPCPPRIKKDYRKDYVPYDEDIADYICDLIATSTMGIKPLCLAHPELPHDTTISRWRWMHPEFSEKYLAAKSHQAQLMAESINDIANERHTFTDADGNERFDSAAVSWQKLRIFACTWQAASLAPRIYGQKQQTDANVTVKHEASLQDLA